MKKKKKDLYVYHWGIPAVKFGWLISIKNGRLYPVMLGDCLTGRQPIQAFWETYESLFITSTGKKLLMPPASQDLY
jgi:hypothetical protein